MAAGDRISRLEKQCTSPSPTRPSSHVEVVSLSSAQPTALQRRSRAHVLLARIPKARFGPIQEIRFVQNSALAAGGNGCHWWPSQVPSPHASEADGRFDELRAVPRG